MSSKGRTINSPCIVAVSYSHMGIIFPFPLGKKMVLMLKKRKRSTKISKNSSQQTLSNKAARVQRDSCLNPDPMLPPCPSKTSLHASIAWNKSIPASKDLLAISTNTLHFSSCKDHVSYPFFSGWSTHINEVQTRNVNVRKDAHHNIISWPVKNILIYTRSWWLTFHTTEYRRETHKFRNISKSILHGTGTICTIERDYRIKNYIKQVYKLNVLNT